jgi:hypothetical protein
MHRTAGTLLSLLLAVCASTVLASAQTTSSPTDSSPIRSVNSVASSTLSAYVYVANSPSSGKQQIKGYIAASDGSLTKMPASPFALTNDYRIAVNGKWLFGTDGINIHSFSIGKNGTLKLADTLEVESNGGLSNLFLDHTGTSLYTDYYTTNNEYLAYSIDNSSGQLAYIDNIMGGTTIGNITSFVGNDEYAYSSSCYHFTPEIYGIQRSSDGAIVQLNITPPFPATPQPGFYCPYGAAADPTNHVAIAMQPLTGDWDPEGPYQLATYTAYSDGNLTTNSTFSNMPTVQVGDFITAYSMSPSGKLLAVAGSSGLQVFHFNGANPITKFTGLLVTDEVDQVFWDNLNHLYAIGGAAGKLWVFTVTSGSAKAAPGSPYSVNQPESLIVLPK